MSTRTWLTPAPIVSRPRVTAATGAHRVRVLLTWMPVPSAGPPGRSHATAGASRNRYGNPASPAALGRGDGDDRAVRVVQDRVDDRAGTVVGRVPAQHDQVGPGGQAGQDPPRVPVDHLVADRDVGVLVPPLVEQGVQLRGRFRLQGV